jgi:sec-independent protein translocase protein TatB
MLDFNAPEFLIVGIVALLVIGPKDLPKALRLLGKWVGKARGIANQFRSGLDNMIRESELAELEKQWKEENERIMRDHPPTAQLPAPQPLLEGELIDPDPVMVAMPELRAEPESVALAPEPKKRAPRARKAPATGDAIEAPKPGKAPATGDTIEAPKPAPKPRKPRAKVEA